MNICKNHAVCVSHKIYESESIAQVLCKLCKCLGPEAADNFKLSIPSALEDVRNANTDKEQKDACEVFLCLLAGLPEMPVSEELSQEIFDLCRQGYLDKKQLYLALASRCETNSLLTFLSHDRKFLRKRESICQGISESTCNIVMELFLVTIKHEVHWFTLLLDELTLLLSQHNSELVLKLLAHPFLEHLWPFLLLYMLEKRSDLSVLNVPVDQCLKIDSCDPSIRTIAKTLHWYLNVVSWITENSVSCSPHPNLYSSNYSTLSLLDQLCNISDLQWDKTHEFLKQHSLDGGFVKKWEIAVYDAFSACTMAFDYILTCLSSRHVKAEFGQTLKPNLDKLKIIVSEIRPVSVRLKVLESIFSLLFLQFEDFHEDVHSDSEEDERDTIQSPQHDDFQITNKSFETMSSSLTSIANTAEAERKGQSNANNASALKSPSDASTWHQSYHKKRGFVCDRYMAQDILKLLESCLTNVSVQDLDSLCDIISDDYILADTEGAEVEQRIKSLQKKVADAQWRLEILFQIEPFPKEDTSVENQHPPDWLLSYCLDEDSASDDESHDMKASNIGPRRPDLEKSSESGSQSNITNSGYGLNSKWNLKSRRRSTTRVSIKSTKDSTIKKMLSSKNSLVVQSLVQDNLEVAKKVIQAFELESSEIANEVSFVEAYDALKRKVDACAVECNRQCKNVSHQQSQNSTLKAIQRAASVGVQASSVNNEVEKLLLCQNLPRIANVGKIPKDYLHLFGGSPHEQPIVSAAVDIALMLSTSMRQAANFLNIASQHSPELRNIGVTHLTRPQSMGFLPLLQSILQVTSCDSMNPSELLHRWDVPDFISRSFRDNVQFWDSLKKLLGDLNDSSNYVSLFPKLLQLTSSPPLLKGNDLNQESMYLEDFKSYLKLLKACQDRASPHDGPLTEEHFALLQRSPYKLFSNMVLLEGMLPQHLECAASQLGFNLPHIISLELCSTLPSIPPSKSDFCFSPTNCHEGLNVLNLSDMIGPCRHPIQTVQSLLLSVLKELSYQLQLLQKVHHFQESSFPISLLNVRRMQYVLVNTWELCNLDLTLLEPGAETLSFFCNLANLMFIHSLIHLYASKGENFNDIRLKSLVSENAIQQLAIMNALSYQVGSAGILTLWEVRQLALGVNVITPFGTNSLQQHAYVTDSCDPLVLFVIFTGTILSPKLQILDPENLEEQLQQAVKEYIRHWVKITSEKVTLPSLIQQYIQSTGQNLKVFLTDHLESFGQNLFDTFPEDVPISHFSDDLNPLFVLDYCAKSVNEVSMDNFNKPSRSFDVNVFESTIQYIKGHSPLVALLLQDLLTEVSCRDEDSDSDGEAHEALEATEMIGSTYQMKSPLYHQYPSLDRLCKRPEVVILSQMFDQNVLLCALHSTIPEELLWHHLNNLASEKKWQTIVDVLNALPKTQLLRNHMLTTMLDLAFLELAVECRDSGMSWKFCERMHSVYFRSKVVIAESIYWSGKVCVDQLQQILQLKELKSYPALFSKAGKLMSSITIYQKVTDNCLNAPWKSWQEVQNASKKNPASVLNQIISHGCAEICMVWLDLHHIVSAHPHLINSKVLGFLLNYGQNGMKAAEHLLKSLPPRKASDICFEAFQILCTLPALRFCVKYLKSHSVEDLSHENVEALEIISLGVQMIEVLPETFQVECLELVRNPHLIIEQLIMNFQLEAAELMLNSVQQELEKLGPKSPLSISALDSMFRQYAEKALEFSISQGSTDSENSALAASLSSHTGSKDVFMPIVVPSKSEWIPNEQAAVCMNCQLSTFTMFNRRHHCRRCGRVVCAQCSAHKMFVQGYEPLKVRVCDNCHLKMNLMTENEIVSSEKLTGATNSEKSLPAENVWRLSNSLEYNETIRGEFSYDHAPSVSLCLSILKLHSQSAACPNFLVDSCETLLSYLLPQGGMPNPEVDYGFVIEMCRSLVLAAKVKCAQWGYVSYEPHCDQRLSKIDLFGLLVSHGCTTLIPHETTNHGLRRLQSQLIEAELWDLALEVSTKAGMEKIGVWTSWGKGCLRVGRWEDAREKFVHCFPNSNRTNRTAPDCPLLLDILQILESTPHFMDQDLLRKAEASRSSNNRLAQAPAITILHSLASLKSISEGNFTQTQRANGSLETPVYSECCYYLREYGSHASYLQFLVRHNDLKAAVEHTLAHSVDPQSFFESVYMPCLRRGHITPLHSAMTMVDSSLIVWKMHLHGICAALERRKLWHTLYEVQQWSKDHVRAAMTCVRFYQLNAKSYSQLAGNINYLMRAQSHLEAALAVTSSSNKANRSGSGRSSSSSSSVEGSESMWLQLTWKELDHHMTTIERQKELTKFLSAYEAEGHTLFEAANGFPHAFAEPLAHGLPTLFGSLPDRNFLAGLGLFCGKNVEEGYGIVYRIIEDFNLNASEIYEAVAVALVHCGRVTEVTQLLNCIRSSGIANVSSACDSLLMTCVREMPNQSNASHIDILVQNISNQAVKIKAFIASGQLKSAYLLAVKHQRLDDVELILQEAERLGQTAIKNICLKRLGR